MSRLEAFRAKLPARHELVVLAGVVALTSSVTACSYTRDTPVFHGGTNCNSPWHAAFVSPGACGYPDPAYGNVGVPPGTTLTPSGSITVTTPGTVINGLDVSGTITVRADNVTIKNTRVTMTTGGCSGCGNSDITITGAYNVTVSHVELTSAGSAWCNDYDRPSTCITVQSGIRNSFGGTLNADHVYVHGPVDQLCWCGDVNVQDSYAANYEMMPGDPPSYWLTWEHNEEMYDADATLTANHNTFINMNSQTANIFVDTNGGSGGACDNHTTITNNLFAGGGYSLYLCGNATSVGSSTMTVTGNRFTRCLGSRHEDPGNGAWYCTSVPAPCSTTTSFGECIRYTPDAYGYFPKGGSYGTHSGVFCAPASSQKWSGNVWDDDGSTVGC